MGARAKELIAAGHPLPKVDESGRTIPWDRVRRQEGKNVIPRVRLPAKELDTNVQPGCTCHESGPCGHCKDNPENLDSSYVHVDEQREQDSIVISPLLLAILDDSSPESLAIGTPLSSSLELCNLECMFRYSHGFYEWQVNANKSPDSGSLDRSLLWDTYLDTFRKIKYCDPSAKTQMLLAAGNFVGPYLRQGGIGLLCELFAVLHESVLCLDWPNIVVLVWLFKTRSCQELGPDNPLTLLFDTMYTEVADPSQNLSKPDSPISKLCLIPLMKCSTREIRICDAVDADDLDAIFDAQEDLICLLQNDVGEGIYDPYEAESCCHQLEQWCSSKFGPTDDARTLRAQGYRAWTYKLQGREDRAVELLDSLWDLWQQRNQANGPEAMTSDIDWCPAWKIARVYRDRQDWNGYRIFGYEAFRWSFLRRGETHGETLRLLDRHINLLEDLYDLEPIDDLKQLYPLSCSLLQRFQNDSQVDDQEACRIGITCSV